MDSSSLILVNRQRQYGVEPTSGDDLGSNAQNNALVLAAIVLQIQGLVPNLSIDAESASLARRFHTEPTKYGGGWIQLLLPVLG